MAIWSTVFVETWKRRERALLADWDLEISRTKGTTIARRAFKYVQIYDSDVNDRIKLDTMSENKLYTQLLQYLFVVVMFAANTFASMAIEGYFDQDGEEPF